MKLVSGVEIIHPNYDAFLVDAWGVLHDGAQCYSGAIDCLQHLAELDKPVIVLSNAARRLEPIRSELARLGIATGMYHSVVSSGELSWQTLKTDSLAMGLGRQAYYLGPERSRSLCDGLDFHWVDNVEEAQWVLNTGAPEGNPRDATGFIPLMKRMARQQLPMICANPDLVAVRAGVPGISAGAIAKLYKSLAGERITYFGKPQITFFELAARQLKQFDKSRLLMVGDAFATDITGAVNYGIDSLLITGGIHARELDPPGVESVKKLAQDYAVEPTWFCQNFSW